MGPKKGKGKGGPVDGVDTTSMSREQLEAFSLRLREELDREREERNFFQLERDKLRTFWEMTRQQLEENRAHLRNQDRIQDENEEKHQSEIKAFKQKVKHLLYEHQCSLSDLKVEGVVALKMAQDEYTAMENELLKDKNTLKTKLKEQELAHQEVVRQLKMEHSAEVSKLREQFAQDATELERKYEARLGTQFEEQGLQHSMELGEVEQRKNRQVVELTKSHEHAFNDMKNYYNDITLNNLALISSLKEQMEELRNGHERMEKQLREVQGENKRLSEPLKQARTELSNLQRQLASYEQDKITLVNTKQRLALVTKELEDLRWENEVLELRFDKVEKERNRLHQEFVGAVLDVQQKTGLKSAMLEKKVADLRGGAVSCASRPGRWRPYRPSRYRSRSRKTPPSTFPIPRPTQAWSPPEQPWKYDARHTMMRRLIPRVTPVKPVAAPGSSDLSSCSCEDAPRTQSCLILKNRCSACVLTREVHCRHRTQLDCSERSHSLQDIMSLRPRCGRRCKRCRRSSLGPGNPCPCLGSFPTNNRSNSKPEGSPGRLYSELPKEADVERSKGFSRTFGQSFVSGHSPSLIVMSLHKSIDFPLELSRNLSCKPGDKSGKKRQRSAATEHAAKHLPIPRLELLEVKPSAAQISLPTLLDQEGVSHNLLEEPLSNDIVLNDLTEETEKDIFVASAPSQESLIAEPFQQFYENQFKPTIIVTDAQQIDLESVTSPTDAQAASESLPSEAEDKNNAFVNPPPRTDEMQSLPPINILESDICFEKCFFPEARSFGKEVSKKEFGDTARAKSEVQKMSPRSNKESAWAKAPERDTSIVSTRRERPSVGIERKLPQARPKSAGAPRPKSPEQSRGRSPGAAVQKPLALHRHAECLAANTTRIVPLPAMAHATRRVVKGKESLGVQARPHTLETSTSIETVYREDRNDVASLPRTSVSTQWSQVSLLVELGGITSNTVPEPVALKPVRRSFGDTSLPITTNFVPINKAIVEEEEGASSKLSPDGDLSIPMRDAPKQLPTETKPTSPSSNKSRRAATVNKKETRKEKSPRLVQSSRPPHNHASRPLQLVHAPLDRINPRPRPSVLTENFRKAPEKVRANPRQSLYTGGKLASALLCDPSCDVNRVSLGSSQYQGMDLSFEALDRVVSSEGASFSEQVDTKIQKSVPYFCDVSCEAHLPDRHEVDFIDTKSDEISSDFVANLPITTEGIKNTLGQPQVLSRASSAISLSALLNRPSTRSFGTSVANVPDVEHNTLREEIEIPDPALNINMNKTSSQLLKSQLNKSTSSGKISSSLKQPLCYESEASEHANRAKQVQQLSAASSKMIIPTIRVDGNLTMEETAKNTDLGTFRNDESETQALEKRTDLSRSAPNTTVQGDSQEDSQPNESHLPSRSARSYSDASCETVVTPKCNEGQGKVDDTPSIRAPQKKSEFVSSADEASRIPAPKAVSDTATNDDFPERHLNDQKGMPVQTSEEITILSTGALSDGSARVVLTRRITSSIKSRVSLPAERAHCDDSVTVIPQSTVPQHSSPTDDIRREVLGNEQNLSSSSNKGRDKVPSSAAIIPSLGEDSEHLNLPVKEEAFGTKQESTLSSEQKSKICHESISSSITLPGDPHNSQSFLKRSKSFLLGPTVQSTTQLSEAPLVNVASGKKYAPPHPPPKLANVLEAEVRGSSLISGETLFDDVPEPTQETGTIKKVFAQKNIENKRENKEPEPNKAEERDPSLISDDTIVGDVPEDYHPTQEIGKTKQVFAQITIEKDRKYKEPKPDEFRSVSGPFASDHSITPMLTTSCSTSVGPDTLSDKSESSSSSTLIDEECDDESDNEDLKEDHKFRNVGPTNSSATKLGLKPSSLSLNQRHRRSKSNDDYHDYVEEHAQGAFRQLDSKQIKSACKPSSPNLAGTAKLRTDLKTKSHGAKGFIKDIFQVLTTGKWPIKRNVMTSTSDLIKTSRSRSAPPRTTAPQSKSELFTKDRHATCYDRSATEGRSPARDHSKASSRSTSDSSNLPSKDSFRRGRSKPHSSSSRSTKSYHHSQHSVHFDFDDSDTNVSTGSGLCHMATWTDSLPSSDSDVSRAKSLPQLPRRGGLKRSSRGDPEKRSRCRSEGRLNQVASCIYADEVISSRVSSKTAFDRHKHCYEERKIFPPIPIRSSSKPTPPISASRKARSKARVSKEASTKPSELQSKRLVKQKVSHCKEEKCSRKAVDQDSLNDPDATAHESVSVSEGSAERAVIWTKPGQNNTISSQPGRAMWLMFPSAVAARSEIDSSSHVREKCKEGGRWKMADGKRIHGSEMRKQDIESDFLSHDSAQDSCFAGKGGESRQSSAEFSAKQSTGTKAKIVTGKCVSPRKSRMSAFHANESSLRFANKLGSHQGLEKRALSSSSSSSGSEGGEVLRVTSLPVVTFPSGASSPRLCKQPLKSRITIQEISNEETLLDECSSDLPIGAVASRLSCLREETDSDVNLDSFNVAHPVVMTSSQSDAWHALEHTLSGSRHRTKRCSHGSSPRRRTAKLKDDDEDLAVRRTRFRSPSPEHFVRSSAACRPDDVMSPASSTSGIKSQKKRADVEGTSGLCRPRTDKIEYRTPRVHFSEEGNASDCIDDDLKNVVDRHFRRLKKFSKRTTPKQSRSVTSIKCFSPVSSSSAASIQERPTKILVSRAKSTASLTGIHDQPRTPVTPSTDSLNKIFGTHGKDVMVVELFKKHRTNDLKSGESPPS